MSKSLTLCLVLLVLNACSNTQYYYLVRHAEKETGVTDAPAPGGPGLTDVGQKRAYSLRNTLKDKHIRQVYFSQYLRTQLTAKPTAEYFNINSPHQYDANANAGVLASELRQINRQNILVVGHSNTIPKLVEALTGTPMPDIAHEDYNNLFVIRKKKKKYTLMPVRTYGTPSP